MNKVFVYFINFYIAVRAKYICPISCGVTRT